MGYKPSAKFYCIFGQIPSRDKACMIHQGKLVTYTESQARDVTRYRALPSVMSRNMR